ncbi:MAG: DUF58 domain-containing protein, partial [Pararhodobacter sp.]|nr:DUF58 domain-containing protein [Pararhodobacter sp.]
HGRRRAGHGAEFWQFRPAAGSDGLRRIDWRRSARGDEHFVRETEWQAARAVALWVDPGAAMDFASRKGADSKGARARLLAMSLALLLLRGGERVGLARPDMPPRSGQSQATTLALALSAPEAGAEANTGTEHGAPDLAALPPGGHAVLFSDFLGDPAPVEAALAQAAARNVRGYLVQMLDPAEEEFPFDGRTRFESMSGHLRFETLRAADLRGPYRQRLAERKDLLDRMAYSAGWRFATLHSDSPPAAGLLWLWQAIANAHGAAWGRGR